MAEEDNIFRNNGQEFCYIPLNEPGLLSKYTLTNSCGTTVEATIELCYKDSQSEFDPQFLKIGFECPKNMEIDDSTLPVMIIEDYSPIMGQMIPGHIGPGGMPRMRIQGPGGPLPPPLQGQMMRMRHPGPQPIPPSGPYIAPMPGAPMPGQMAMGGPQSQSGSRRFRVDGSFIRNKNQFQVKIQKNDQTPRYNTGPRKMVIGMEISLIQVDSLPSIKDLKLNLFDEMVESFKNNEDFKIVCKGETIGVSKALLQSLSDVFRRMTTNCDNKEAIENSVKIDDTDPETIKQFKTFVLDTDKIVAPPNTDLLLFANKYKSLV